MAQTDVDVVNQAIDQVGGEPIEALNEDSPLADFCLRQYPPKRDFILGLYRWVFATTFVQLGRIDPDTLLTPPPLANVFALPGDLIGACHAFRDGPRVDACNVRTLVGDIGACSDAAALWAEYTARKPEAAWPSTFTNFVATAFAADLAGRRPNEALRKQKEELAWGTPDQNREGGLFLQARNADARQAPERALFYDSPGPLIEARMQGFRPNPFAVPPILVTDG